MTARSRHPRFGADVRVAAALGQQQNPQSGPWAEGGDEYLGVGGGQVADRGDAESSESFGGLWADAPQCADVAIAHDRHPVVVVEAVYPGGLSETGRHLGALLVVTDPDRTRESRLRLDDVPDAHRQLEGVRHVGAEVSLVPPPHLQRMAEIAKQCHHLLGRLVIGCRVRRQKRRLGALPGGDAQRHARVHAVGARFIGRAGHYLARLGWVTIAADDHGEADELGAPSQFDRREELVEVDVQYPHRCYVPQSLCAKLSHASPCCWRLRPRSST